MNDERQEWEDLLRSPGWARLVEKAQAEWNGPAFVSLVEQLADKPDDLQALSKLRQMLASKRAVERMLGLPRERVAQLVRIDTPSHEGRRGVL